MKRYFFTLLYLISSINIFSQNTIYKGAITYGDSLLPKLIQFDERLPRSTDVQQVFADNLELTTMDSFVKVSEVTDKLGRLHEKYQHYYNGIKVEGGIYNVHYTLASEIAALNGYFYPVNNISVTPNMSESTALNYALNAVNAQEYVWQNNESEQWLRTESNDSNATFYPQGELMLLRDSTGYNQQLVYRFNIISSQPFNSQVLYVDAVNGNVVEQYSTFSNAFGDACTHYSGIVPIETILNTTTNNYELHDNTRGGGIITRNLKGGSNPLNLPLNPEFEDPNDLISPNDWTCAEWDNSLKDNLAFDAHWSAAMVYDYFWQQHNRNSFDNQGSVIDVYVHHQLMDYAAWLGTTLSPFGSVFGMVFGDGNSTQFDGLVSLDIVAHEFAHGITQSTSNLLSSGISESPAINEGLSDIWGAVVEDWLLNTVGFIDPEGDKDPWLAGEEVRLDFAAQRSLKNPKNTSMAQSMADTYNGLNYSGLRGKSGVFSHWFYLLSEGSSATDEINDNGDPFSLTGIGINKAADIVYYAQTVYFTKYTDYKDARQYTLQAAKDLFGQCSLEALAVAESWDAVGVDGNNIDFFVQACGDVVNGIYQNSTLEFASDIIYSGEHICYNVPVTVLNGSQVVFKAGDEIVLFPGFRVEANADFNAYITNCSSNSNFRTSDNNNSKSEEEKNIGYFSGINNNIKVYPNPNNGQFIIEWDNNTTTGTIAIYDLMSKLVWSKAVTETKTTIDISNQPKGIYLVKVISGNKVYTQKLVYQ